MKNIVTFSFMSADVNATSSTINCNKTRSIIELMLSDYFDRGRNSIGMHSTELSQCYELYLGLHGQSILNEATKLMMHSTTHSLKHTFWEYCHSGIPVVIHTTNGCRQVLEPYLRVHCKINHFTTHYFRNTDDDK